MFRVGFLPVYQPHPHMPVVPVSGAHALPVRIVESPGARDLQISGACTPPGRPETCLQRPGVPPGALRRDVHAHFRAKTRVARIWPCRQAALMGEGLTKEVTDVQQKMPVTRDTRVRAGTRRRARVPAVRGNGANGNRPCGRTRHRCQRRRHSRGDGHAHVARHQGHAYVRQRRRRPLHVLERAARRVRTARGTGGILEPPHQGATGRRRRGRTHSEAGGGRAGRDRQRRGRDTDHQHRQFRSLDRGEPGAGA